MTNRFSCGRSYGELLEYCLQDKRQRQRQEQNVAEEHQPTRNRAEVLYYNLCYGNEQELLQQFKEVQKLNHNMVKPAFHLSLSFPPGEKISKSRFVDIAKDCAKALDFERHQYVVIRHKDTPHPHIHLVVNRIGADGHIMKVPPQLLRRVIEFCRDTERKYQLTPVPTIYRYRSPEERLVQSQHPRVIQLKEVIRQTLERTADLGAFSEGMQEQGYKVYKNDRGIAFKDRDAVVMRGSEVGYPWKKIEAELALRQTLKQKQELRQHRGLRIPL